MFQSTMGEGDDGDSNIEVFRFDLITIFKFNLANNK